MFPINLQVTAYFAHPKSFENIEIVALRSTVNLVYNDTLGVTKMCCHNQGVVAIRAFSTETTEPVTAICVVVKRLML